MCSGTGLELGLLGTHLEAAHMGHGARREAGAMLSTCLRLAVEAAELWTEWSYVKPYPPPTPQCGCPPDKEVIPVKRIHKLASWSGGISVFKNSNTRDLVRSSLPREDTAGRCPSASREESSHQAPNECILILDFPAL